MRIGIVVGSIRERRRGGGVGRWVADRALRLDVEVDLIDLRSLEVPLLTAPTHPMQAGREYTSEAVRSWSRAVDRCDGFVFVTPEYNHGLPGAFKNAVDSLGPEWVGKSVAFVSYGSVGGVRAVEQWRQVVANFEMVDVRAQVTLSTFSDVDADGRVTADERLEGDLDGVLDSLVSTTAALLAGRRATSGTTEP